MNKISLEARRGFPVICAGRGTMKRKHLERDHEIFQAYSGGETALQLAITYGVSRNTIHGIIAAERHRRAVSGEAFYRELRSLPTAGGLFRDRPTSAGDDTP